MKAFFRSKRGIVCLILAAVLILGSCAFGGYQLWLYQQPKFQPVTIELGTQKITLDQFLTPYARIDKASFVTEPTPEALSKPGQIPVTLQHGSKKETVLLTVQDTTAPTATFNTHRTEAAGYIPVAEDFVTQVQDFSPTTVTFKQTPVIPDDYTDVELTVVVTDISGNSTEQQCILTYSWMRSEITLELGEKLTKAHILLQPEQDAALVEQAAIDSINAAGVGVYSISSTSGGHTMECTVTVADTVPPALELKSVQVYIGGTAKVDKFVVKADDASGPPELSLLTKLDSSKLGSYPVQIQAVDAHGNTTIKETTFEVITDTTPPAISGLKAMQVAKNSTPDYMKGVSAYDSKDGTCTVSYNAEAVDLSKAGTYYVVYTATDKSGNTAKIKREVEVLWDYADTLALVARIATAQGSDPEALRDYVRNSITYTASWGGDDPVYFGFTKKHGNCYVHNMCLKALLDYHGYQTQLIWVTDKSHYWLQIYLNGKWMHIDATPGNTHTIYSLMNDAQRLETLRGRQWDFDKWPACP